MDWGRAKRIGTFLKTAKEAGENTPLQEVFQKVVGGQEGVGFKIKTLILTEDLKSGENFIIFKT